MAMLNNQIVRFYKPQKIKQSRKQRRCGACGAAGVMAEVPKPWPPRCPQPLEVRLRPAGSWKIIVTSLKTIGKSRKTIGISWNILEHHRKSYGRSIKIIGVGGLIPSPGLAWARQAVQELLIDYLSSGQG